jgi:predicted secreted protein
MKNMKRDKNIVVVCHCILNCNSKVEGLSEYRGAVDFTKKLVDSGIGIIQLPCPEMILYGIKRWGTY